MWYEPYCSYAPFLLMFEKRRGWGMVAINRLTEVKIWGDYLQALPTKHLKKGSITTAYLSCFNPGKRQNLLQTCALTKAAIARTFRFPAQKRNSSSLSSICAVAFQGHTTCAHYLVGQPPAISCKFEMS